MYMSVLILNREQVKQVISIPVLSFFREGGEGPRRPCSASV